MIGPLLAVGGAEGRGALRRNFRGLIGESVLMGVGFALSVPLLRAMFAGAMAEAWAWMGGMAALLCAYAVLRYRAQLAGYMAAIALARSLFARLGEHIARLPLGWFGAETVGQVGRLTSQGVIDVTGVPAHLLRPLVTALATPATVILLMFVFDWRLALAALITAPIAAVLYRWTGVLTQRTDHQVHASAAEAAGRVVEFAQTQPVLRAFGEGARGLGRLDAALEAQHAAAKGQMTSVARGLLSLVLVMQVAFTILLIFGVNLALGGEIEAAELVALLVLMVRYVEPILGAAELDGALRIARNSIDRMNALLDAAPLPEPASPQTPDGSEVRFEDVGFGYGEAPVLSGVSFTAPEQAMTAIVGPSGSGKTTVLRLIARFWDVGSGTVRVGGVDVRDIATEELMSRISVVFQDVYLFKGTIAENIRLGRPEASDAEVAEAARLARVDEIAARLPDGMAAEVGEGGSVLSGGERQRVSIARAILKDARIVLLDEATSALDPANELAVQEALRSLTRDKTLIVVAHRLQTVRAADRIVVLDDRRVVETGAHEELLAAGGRYARFWSERSRASGWRLASAEVRTEDRSAPT
ncbi:MAG: ABC transporter ATP-binding protein [Pseudomonadota bacterium]